MHEGLGESYTNLHSYPFFPRRKILPQASSLWEHMPHNTNNLWCHMLTFLCKSWSSSQISHLMPVPAVAEQFSLLSAAVSAPATERLTFSTAKPLLTKLHSLVAASSRSLQQTNVSSMQRKEMLRIHTTQLPGRHMELRKLLQVCKKTACTLLLPLHRHIQRHKPPLINESHLGWGPNNYLSYTDVLPPTPADLSLGRWACKGCWLLSATGGTN